MSLDTTPTLRRPRAGQVVTGSPTDHAAPPRPARPTLGQPVALLALFLAAAASRLAVTGRILINWDAVQYALGLTDFDVVRHQPHPPGSILYEGLGRLALFVTHDANQALSWISVLAGAASVVLCYLAGRELFGSRLAWAGTALYAVSPLTWFYGAVALPYGIEGALSLAAVLLCWRAMEERERRAALWAAVVLAVAGGIRQTTMLLLLPLWVYATFLADWRRELSPGAERGVRAASRRFGGFSWNTAWTKAWFPRFARDDNGRVRDGRGEPFLPRTLMVGLLLLGGLCLLWVVPLLVLSGGVGRYVTASRELSSLVSSLTSVWVVGLPGAAANVQYTWDVATFGLNLALVCFAVYLLPFGWRARWPWRPGRAQRWFLALWAAPALAVYGLLHIGQAGYLLIVWPLACFAAAQAALSAAEAIGGRRNLVQRSRFNVQRRWPGRFLLGVGSGGVRQAALAVVVLLCAASVALFLLPPLAGPPSGLSYWAIRDQDAFWQELPVVAGRLGASQTVVLTGTQSDESFRHAEYYLPGFHVMAVGLDRSGTLGVAFRAYRGAHDYDRFMAGGKATEWQPLPPGTTRLLILDQSAAQLFRKDDLEPIQVTADRKVWLYPVTSSGAGLDALNFSPPLAVERG